MGVSILNSEKRSLIFTQRSFIDSLRGNFVKDKLLIGIVVIVTIIFVVFAWLYMKNFMIEHDIEEVSEGNIKVEKRLHPS